MSSEKPPGVDPVWQYHVQEVNRGVQDHRLYETRIALAHLQRLDADRFQREGFPLTAAWVARQSGNWETNWRQNTASGSKEPWTLLESAESLIRMNRHREARALLFSRKSGWQGRRHFLRQALLAESYLASEMTDEAVGALRKLTRRGAPAHLTMTAYEQLIALYYRTGQFSRARALAERVQSKRPASDAALGAMHLQQSFEKESYLNRVSTWNRFAMVCYRNRDFDRSDHYFKRVAETLKNGKVADKARYYLALTHGKREKPDAMLAHLREKMPELEQGVYAGQAAFQMARTLFLNGLDEETIDYVRHYQRVGKSPKWRRESMRLLILALRRAGDHADFDTLEGSIERKDTPRWLKRYYHRNGMIWALQEGRHQDARYHMERYTGTRLGRYERQESRVWSGVIQWELGDKQGAVRSWLDVLERDPNHYFGLVARELVREYGAESGLWASSYPAGPARLASAGLKSLRRLYFLAPDDTERTRVAEALRDHIPLDTDFLEGRPLKNDRATRLAAVGRYDLAARSLTKKKRSTAEYHYLKARWHQIDHNLHDSLRHAEILLSSYPRWVPYELMPEPIQELNFPKGFDQIVAEKSETFGVDPYLLLAIIREESRFDVNAKSWAGARGLMQFIPSTAHRIAGEIDDIERFSLPMLYDPKTAITLGARYVDNLMTNYDGTPLYTIAAYNAGEGAVDRWRSFSGDSLEFVWDVTYNETKMYCQKVLRAYHHYTRVYQDETPGVIEPPSLGEFETREPVRTAD
ncbi:MAG: transglycosylase SLT domain-containing protein [Acidobacteriota bacterium]|nr:transglycosylase SLT domain-containing protein [Acidobacteriota bacterium]